MFGVVPGSLQPYTPTEYGYSGSLDRFSRFTEDMVTLILDQGGSLKAEHGTGRMMAPFVRRQYEEGKGVPSRLVFFPDENHWILKPRNSQLWYREFFAWLSRWVKPGGKSRSRR